MCYGDYNKDKYKFSGRGEIPHRWLGKYPTVHEHSNVLMR